jgi:SH3-like domain-containing protein
MSLQHIWQSFGGSGRALFVTLLVTILLFASTVRAGSERPRAGQGILLLRPAFAEQAETLKALQLYDSPGIKRVATVNADRLPSLSQVVPVPFGIYAIAVTGKRGNWYRLVYDESGREGWIKARQYWVYYRWPDFLPGRHVALLPDLRASLAEVHLEPLDRSPVQGTVSSGQRLRVIEIRDRWMLVQSDDGKSGWLRWCDSNGMMVVALAE